MSTMRLRGSSSEKAPLLPSDDEISSVIGSSSVVDDLKAHCESVTQVLSRYNISDVQYGLSMSQVLANREKYGKNGSAFIFI